MTKTLIYPVVGKFYQARSSGRKVQCTKIAPGHGFYGVILMNDGSTMTGKIGGMGNFQLHWKEIAGF